MLSVWVLTGMRNFRITQGVMRNLHFLFKDVFSSSHAHFLLHFSQHLSSNHQIPSLSSFLHHSPLSTPPWQPISITPPHSRAVTIHHRPPFNFQLFPPSKTSQFLTQHSKSIPQPISALYLPIQNLKLSIQATFSSKRTHCRRFFHLCPPQSKPSEPHFITSLCLRPEEDIPQLPRASRYHTRRASATPVAPTQIPPRGPPTKKAKTSEPGESSRAPRDSQSQPPSTRRPRPSSPIEGNSDCRSKAFHVEAYFDHTILRQQTDLRDSYSLLERYHLVPFMTPPQFFYPRVVLDFYQSMTTRGVPVPASILFTIDGRQGILGARQIAEAFHIPYAPADPTAFRRWAPLSEWDMVRSLSRGTSSQRTIFRRELPQGCS
ncbi:hypothetical protein CK203_044571 [Vitis vinifera]|uniref:Uncharacterized protein n=1 Tax=Vitis vinifera TaxID=29760 RepID=A0A438HJQ1_VITVI|nr:hypothetical protein CK203_044571 [Vitis vinifera]